MNGMMAGARIAAVPVLLPIALTLFIGVSSGSPSSPYRNSRERREKVLETIVSRTFSSQLLVEISGIEPLTS